MELFLFPTGLAFILLSAAVVRVLGADLGYKVMYDHPVKRMGDARSSQLEAIGNKATIAVTPSVVRTMTSQSGSYSFGNTSEICAPASL